MTQPPGALLPYLLAVLTPLLTAGGTLDPDLARQAAMETIAACDRPLLTSGQIVAFALAALENLRLSAPPDLSLSMKLKLRGNANALNRASQKTAALRDDNHPTETPDQAETMASLESAQTLITQARADKPATQERKTDLHWGQAMTEIAAEYTAELPVLSPDQRRTHLTRIGVLSKIAAMLVQGDAPPLKSRLLAGTAMPT
ncbi:MAG TPA: hypothetical protein VGM42_19180 [Rhodopila sp.]